ncbi:c-type cytochrome [Terrarubrum flagellatum]|uniref:c-type cytochrome n=1 Tax=Terrirubrum flagellatum TaxID=2895980 RepID=UPI00314503EA
MREPLRPISLSLAAFAALAALSAAAQPKRGDAEFGRYLSAECVACHQLSGRAAGIPAITGWPEDAFVAALSDYRAKRRANVIMQTVAGKFSDEEIAALAAYFGGLGQTPPR